MESILRCYGYEVLIRDVVRASGCDLFDARGGRTVDLESGVWCAGLGHNHPRVANAIRSQLQRLTHVGYRITTPLVEEAGSNLLATLGLPEGRCVFLSSGSEAMECALLAARQVTGRRRFIALRHAYLGAYGLSSRSRADEWTSVNWEDCADCGEGGLCAVHARSLDGLPLGEAAALVFEPGNSGGLVRFPPEPFVRALARRVRDAGGLLIVDEVTTGLGRTGAWFGFEHYGLKPDAVALGKGLGNGYPVSAAAFSSEVAEVLEATGFHHAQSHQDDPMGCAVVREVLRVLPQEGLVERSARLGKVLLEGLSDLAARKTSVREARGRGLMAVLEFEPDGPGFSLGEIHRRLLDRGFLAGFKPSARVLRFYPPLVLPENEIHRLLAALEELS
jgi:acetylornithine aminotransferase